MPETTTAEHSIEGLNYKNRHCQSDKIRRYDRPRLALTEFQYSVLLAF